MVKADVHRHKGQAVKITGACLKEQTIESYCHQDSTSIDLLFQTWVSLAEITRFVIIYLLRIPLFSISVPPKDLISPCRRALLYSGSFQ